MRISVVFCAVLLAASLSGCAGENEANKANKKAISKNSSDIDLRLAHASEDAGDFPAAEKLYKQAAEKNSDIPSYVELAEFYDRHRGERLALKAINEALELDPKNTDLLRASANIHIKLGEAGDALKVIDEALAVHPGDGLLYNSKGVALDMLGRYTHARNAYSTALGLDPEDGMMFNSNLGMSYITNGEYKKAIKLLQPIADSADATPQIRQNLALAYGLSGDTDNAAKYGEKDITGKDAQENMKFYKLFTDRESRSGRLTPPPKVSDKITSIPPIP